MIEVQELQENADGSVTFEVICGPKELRIFAGIGILKVITDKANEIIEQETYEKFPVGSSWYTRGLSYSDRFGHEAIVVESSYDELIVWHSSIKEVRTHIKKDGTLSGCSTESPYDLISRKD